MKKRMIWISIILFIGINSLLVWLDNEGKVERIAYVSTWEKVYLSDLYETAEAEGVIEYAGESYVYFDKAMGSFDSFLVEEGSMVSVGDPLFQFHVHNYKETEDLLTYELEKVHMEIDAIEESISKMVAYQIPSAATPVVGNGEEDRTTVIVTPQEPLEAEVMKEQFIIQKEQELKAKQEEMQLVQSQLESLQSTGNIITVDSPFSGRVKKISSTLEDPLIRIEDTSLQVRGNIDEATRINIEENQTVEIALEESEQVLQGIVQHIGDTPYDVSVYSESIYPIEIRFTEDQALDHVLPGYHADLTIMIEESIDASTVHSSTVKDNYVWKLNEVGRLELVPIQSGIEMGEELEVISGLSKGDVVTGNSFGPSFEGMPFITPLKVKQLPWLEINKYGNWFHYLTMGILVR